ncbi:DUF4349 domain-containing protein [Kamptonema formosum]|uniref:DUF4349 domain-containing protein n=1 Tax=Kamptonema formosum TaxID=331992 RepID=UPI00034D6116|nr:DUF4349 domain-containing protein [Oscillatoria sp. PCC 10802]
MNTHLKAKSPQHFFNKTNHAGTERLLTLTLLGLLSAVTLPSCGGGSYQDSAQFGKADMKAPAPAAKSEMAPVAPANLQAAAAEAPRSQPQLIKKAELNLLVKSIDQSIREVSAIAKQQQGDILGLQDNKPLDPSSRHTASVQIRVPQNKLETTLNALAKLGTVQNRSLTVEDVTSQLVDSEARLRNLRKSEEMVLKIMERSGSVGDVLKAANELSTIRESIERLDAQLKSMRNQVAYSTINLNLEAAISAGAPAQPALGLRVQETWGKATNSLSEFTFSLFAFILWLLVFSPYLLLGAGAVYGVNRFRKPKK